MGDVIMANEIEAISTNNYILSNPGVVTDASLSGDGTYQSPIGVVPGYNETVLLNNNYANQSTTSFTVSEPLSAFEQIRFAGLEYNNTVCKCEIMAPSGTENISVLMQYWCPNGDSNPYQMRMAAYKTNDGLTYSSVSGKFLYFTHAGLSAAGGNTTTSPSIQKIYGINRKA